MTDRQSLMLKDRQGQLHTSVWRWKSLRVHCGMGMTSQHTTCKLIVKHLTVGGWMHPAGHHLPGVYAVLCTRRLQEPATCMQWLACSCSCSCSCLMYQDMANPLKKNGRTQNRTTSAVSRHAEGAFTLHKHMRRWDTQLSSLCDVDNACDAKGSWDWSRPINSGSPMTALLRGFHMI